jgi:2'-5' RNA ligase
MFSGASEIDAIRDAHDPLASKIRPHITLVFPFESALSPGALAAHVRNAVASTECFHVSLGLPQIRAGGFIWLPALQGRNEIMALHDALYRGPLGLHLDTARPYEPHLTVARVEGSGFEKAYDAALALRGPFEAHVDHLIVEAIMPDENSNLESTIDLKN